MTTDEGQRSALQPTSEKPLHAMKTIQIAPDTAGKPAALKTFQRGTSGQEKKICEYWMTDLSKRFQEMLSCKACKPTPTNKQDLHKKIRKTSLKSMSCPKCGEEKICLDFWPLDLVHKHRPNLGCKTCKPILPHERRKRKELCKLCGKEKMRSDFWPVDLVHKSRPKFGCKECNPIHPSERRVFTRKRLAKALSNEMLAKRKHPILDFFSKKKKDAKDESASTASTTMNNICSSLLAAQ